MNSSYRLCQDSDVGWLGDIPRHWEVKRLKLVASINDDALSDKEDPLRPIMYVDIGSVNSAGEILEIKEMVYEDAPSRARRLVKDGDTILSTVRTYLRAIASIRQPPLEMVVSTGFAVIRPQSVEGDYASWVLKENGFVEEIVARSVGVSYPAINPPRIADLPIPIPPPKEQRAIAAFLDQETSKVDALVAKNRGLIERLEEYRAALISRTVTRGLPPDAARAAGLNLKPRFKTSGVEWLGDVPAHWNGTLVKHCYNIQLGKMLQPEPSSRSDIETPYLKAQHVQWNGVNTNQPPTMWASEVDLQRYGIREGDLLVCEGGEGGRASLLGPVPPGYVIQNALHRVRAKATSHNGFLRYWLAAFSATGWLEASTNKATIAHFTKEKFSALPFFMPPLPEQEAIAAFLDRETERIEALHSKVEKAIERLLEYRTALITAAVTGKIDVRDSEMVGTAGSAA